MKNKTFELIKKYRIGIKELENSKMGLSLLYKIRSIYSKEKQEKIELFEVKKEVHSYKYRYIMAKYNQKIGREEKALNLYYSLLNNFPYSDFFYSILIEVTRMEKLEFIYEIYLKYQLKIEKAPYKIKALLIYNTGVLLLFL